MHAVRDHYADPFFDDLEGHEIIIDNRTNNNEHNNLQIDLKLDKSQRFFSGQDSLQFVDENLQIVSAYWIEQLSDILWIKVLKISASGMCTLRMFDNNPSLSSVNDGGNTFEFFDEDWRNIPLEQNATSSYDGFGIIIKTGDDTILHFYRQGTSHLGDKGKIVKRTYTISTNSWSSASDVFVDDTYDCRDVCGGIIGNYIFLFFTRYNHSADTYVDLGYIKSTNLTGTSWGSRVTMTTTANYRYNPHGALIHITGNTYIQPWYEHNGSGTWKVKLYKTTNSGTDWSTVSIYSGTIQMCEPSIAYIGESKLIALMSANDGGYVKQATSSDNGDTWSSVVDTNLGAATGKKIPFIIYDSVTGNVINVYHDRGDDETKISETSASTVYSSASSWNTPDSIDSGYDKNGYASITKIFSGRYFFVYTKEITSSDADIWGCEYPVKWSYAGAPSVSSGVISLDNDDAILGKTAFGYNYAIVLRAKANEQDIRFIMFGDTIELNCQNRLGITNTDIVPDVFDRFEYFAMKTGSGSSAHFIASDFRNMYFKYQIQRVEGQADFYQGSTHLGNITASENLPTISLYPKAIVWDSSQESTLDIDWVFVRKYAYPEPTAEIGMML